MKTFIHLLYVPTMVCNMACRYCYLGEDTNDLAPDKKPLSTLQYAVDKLMAADVMPFNISLHGGEVTTLSKEDFRDVVAYIDSYYKENSAEITRAGFKVGRPHIKTNLLRLDQHLDTIRDYAVSVSGSLDLPLSMHEAYRVTKDGRGTMERILANAKLLANLPNRKKVSATLFREHLEHLDELIADIRYLDQETPFDMNDFNFMFGFADPAARGSAEAELTPIGEEEMAAFFDRMHAEFDGTSLDAGVNGPWFAEFGPGYCTNCTNCGEKFFLLEKNGDIYSCVRGQGNRDFYYGNIFRDDVETILATARQKIFEAHEEQPFDDDCAKCGYLYLCKTGCPYVKKNYGISKSYTCILQQKLYARDGYERHAEPDPSDSATDPALAEELAYEGKLDTYDYVTAMRPEAVEQYRIAPEDDPDDPLPGMIKADPSLSGIYDPNAFILHVDGQDHRLESQILKKKREFIYICKGQPVTLYVRKDLLDLESKYPANNALYIMGLSGDMITYGDEGRTKQAHLFTHQIYKGVLEGYESDRDGYYRVELGRLLELYADAFAKDEANNLFFTTTDLRTVHYDKQRGNAYYHIRAIDLPFQNIEFYYLTDELAGEGDEL